MAITIVGLGPGNPNQLTREAWQILQEAAEIYVRTREHPVVAILSPARVRGFDEIYARMEDFDEVYDAIARQVVALGQRPEGVVYAVPGHPRVGELTTPRIEELAEEHDLPVHIVGGMSFLEPVFDALRLDPLAQTGLQLTDAMIIAQRHYPPLDPTLPTLIAQCYNRFLASDVKLTLLNAYPETHPITVLSGAGTEQSHIRTCPLVELDRHSQFDYLTTLYLPPIAPGGSVTELQEVMAHLRAPDGCPWDRQQTHESLRTYLLEETYEVLDALDRGDTQALCEELGDLLLQIVFHTQIATEEAEFRMADVASHIVTKLWRRHPHVFGDVSVEGVGDVLRNWEAIKAAERQKQGKGQDDGPLSGIPKGLPALAQARAYLSRAERLGVDRPDTLQEASALLSKLAHTADAETLLGDLLLTLVNWARHHDLDAESALRAANARLAEQSLQAYATHQAPQDQGAV